MLGMAALIFFRSNPAHQENNNQPAASRTPAAEGLRIVNDTNIAVAGNSASASDDAIKGYQQQLNDSFHELSLSKRLEKIAQLLQHLASLNPQLACDWLQMHKEDVPPQFLQDQFGKIIFTWSTTDPKSAAFYAGDLPSNEIPGGSAALAAAAYLVADKNAALAWGLQLTSEQGSAVRQGMFSALAKDDPVRAKNLLMGLPLAQQRESMSVVISKIGSNDPTGTAAWVAGLNDPVAQQRAVFGLMPSWADTAPQAAANWVDSLPAGPLKSNALQSLATSWSQSDPVAEAAWLQNIPTGTDRDYAVANLSTQLLKVDPSSAATWAATITDEKIRIEKINEAVAEWRQTDPQAAQKWFDSSQQK